MNCSQSPRSRRILPFPGWPLRGRLVAMLLAVPLLTLVPLAHASPPDPTWISGLYDDADHDDAVIAITDASGSPARDAAAIVPAGLSGTAMAFAGPKRPSKPSRITLLDRSPPLS
jgi:hypothetical protein